MKADMTEDCKVQYCTGPVCGSMGFYIEVEEELQKYFPDQEVQPTGCMGFCDIGGAFSIGSISYAGEDLDRLPELVSKKTQRLTYSKPKSKNGEE